MKRQDIMCLIPSVEINDEDLEKFEEWMKETLDYMESEFSNIRDLLNISSAEDLVGVSEARKKAEDLANDLY